MSKNYVVTETELFPVWVAYPAANYVSLPNRVDIQITLTDEEYAEYLDMESKMSAWHNKVCDKVAELYPKS